MPPGMVPVTDNFIDIGPLAGIEASLKVASTKYLFIFGGDMPWLSEEIITRQVRSIVSTPAEVILPRIGNMIEPLHAIYSRSIHESLVKYIKAGGKPAVRDFIRLCKVRYLELPRTEATERAFTNINTPADLR